MNKVMIRPSNINVSQIKKAIPYLETNDYSGFYDNIMRNSKIRPFLLESKVKTHNREWFQSALPEMRGLTAETARKLRMLVDTNASDDDFKDAMALLDVKYAEESYEQVTEDSYFDLIADSLLFSVGNDAVEALCQTTTFYPSFVITMMGGV